MVNRGGRSKGCATCRSRHVKCDERRPHCERCRKAGLRCSGYVPYGEFVDETARFRAREVPAPSEKPAETLAGSSSSDIVPATRQAEWLTHPPHRPLLPDEDAIVHTHLISKLLPRDSGQSSTHFFPSLVAYASSTPGESVPKEAVRALAAVYFGKLNRDVRIFEKGVRAYVRSLSMLRLTLASPASALEVKTLASVLCLGLYENIAFSHRTGWLRHYEGVSRLIELRGPSRHQSGMDRELFRHCRFAIIISALVGRRHCYLSQPEWKALSRSTMSALEDESGGLLDILADVPGILHDYEVIRTSTSTPAFAALLRQRVRGQLLALHDWGQHRRTLPPAVDHRPPPSSAETAFLALQALHSAILLCLAPACETLSVDALLLEIAAICPRSDYPGSLMEPGIPTHAAAKTALALHICLLANLCFGNDPSSTGAFLFIFPLQVASQYLEADSDEARWAEQVMKSVIVETHGFELGRQREWAHLRSARDDITP